MSSNGKGGNNRKNRRYNGRRDESQRQVKKHPGINNIDNSFYDDKIDKDRAAKTAAGSQDRPQWTAPVQPANPITTPDCPWCGKPIKEIATAICDKDSGLPVHFDCVLSRISDSEKLELNDSVCYIGGGRFGIIHYNNPPDTRDFTIKKIFEWENKDSKSEWRKPISEYFSLT